MENDLLMERMVEAEAVLDARLLKRQSELQDASFKVNRTKRSLSLKCHPVIGDNDVFTFKLSGSLDVLPSSTQTLKAKPFTHFISSLHLEVGNSNNNSEDFSWSKDRNPIVGNLIEFQKTIPKPHPKSIRMVLMINETPSPYLLSTPLAALMGRKRATKPQAILAIWQYVKGNKLQESEEKKVVLNDSKLKELFSVERMSFSEIPSRLLPHLLPNVPLSYNLTLDSVNDIKIEFEMDEKACYEDPTTVSNRIKQRDLLTIEREQNEIILALRASIHQKALYSELRECPNAALTRMARMQQSPEAVESREANNLFSDEQEDSGRLTDIVRVLLSSNITL